MNNPENKTIEQLRDELAAKEKIYEPKYGGKDHSGYETMMKYEINYEREECFCKGFDARGKIEEDRTKKLVEALDQALRQWHMYMTDMQRDDLNELLKDSNNIEAHLFKYYQNLFEEFKDLK